MTPRQLRRRLKRLSLSQRRFARIVNVDGRTVRHWTAGNHRIPSSVALLLDAWQRHRDLIPQPPRHRGKQRRTA
jgi:DNA-binding transcriptional regulator YiaG